MAVSYTRNLISTDILASCCHLLCDSVMYSGCYSSCALVFISGSGSTTGCWQKTAWR